MFRDRLKDRPELGTLTVAEKVEEGKWEDKVLGSICPLFDIAVMDMETCRLDKEMTSEAFKTMH